MTDLTCLYDGNDIIKAREVLGGTDKYKLSITCNAIPIRLNPNSGSYYIFNQTVQPSAKIAKPCSVLFCFLSTFSFLKSN